MMLIVRATHSCAGPRQKDIASKRHSLSAYVTVGGFLRIQAPHPAGELHTSHTYSKDTFHCHHSKLISHPQGDVGPRGFSGIEGPSGALGANGERGPKGEKGHVGLQVGYLNNKCNLQVVIRIICASPICLSEVEMPRCTKHDYMLFVFFRVGQGCWEEQGHLVCQAHQWVSSLFFALQS